jgi:hypothetical protein
MSLLTKGLELNTNIIDKKQGYVLSKNENNSYIVYSEMEMFQLFESEKMDEAKTFFEDLVKGE